MSLCRIETEDGTFHGQLIYGDDDEIIGEELLLDESGDPIPISLCLCFAHTHPVNVAAKRQDGTIIDIGMMMIIDYMINSVL